MPAAPPAPAPQVDPAAVVWRTPLCGPPGRCAHDEGGYEVGPGVWARVAEGAGECPLDTSARLLERLR